LVFRRVEDAHGTEPSTADLHVQNFKAMVERVPAVVYVAEAGEDGKWLYVSPAIEGLLGFTPEEWAADPYLWSKRLHPEDRERVLKEEHSDLVESTAPSSSDYRLLAKDGTVVWVRDRATVADDGNGRVAYYQGLLVEIGEQKAAEQALQQSERRFKSLLEHGTDLVLVLDSIGSIHYCSPSIQNLLGFGPEEVIGRVVFELIHPLDSKVALERFVRLVPSAKTTDMGELRVVHADKSVRWMEAHALNLLEDESVKGVVVNCRDTTERRVLEARLRHLAYHDSLTGLPNRVLFMDRLGQALARLARSGHMLAVLFIDLDDFKEINDHYGHAIGDEVLAIAAQKIGKCLRPSDSAARLGGDEFALVLEDLNEPDDAGIVAKRIFGQLEEPIEIKGNKIPLEVSIGVAIGESSEQQAEQLLIEADKAMYQAKAGGKHRWQYAHRQLPGLD
jgi:diguanylate cyclase (GGDEF)-like protein/PAS domain S-box-containing protein